MKNLIFMLLLAGSIGGVYAQNAEKKDKFSPDTPLFEELTNVKKKTEQEILRIFTSTRTIFIDLQPY